MHHRRFQVVWILARGLRQVNLVKNLDLHREYGVVRKTKFVKGSRIDLRTDLTRKELTLLQRDFHNRLWGGAKIGDTDVFKSA